LVPFDSVVGPHCIRISSSFLNFGDPARMSGVQHSA
jgi:hypothetical protein